MILGNTYHLTLRPGDELIKEMGGLHRFMAWDGPILTDSGGFQIYSLAPTRKITDHAAVFRSHIDGACSNLRRNGPSPFRKTSAPTWPCVLTNARRSRRRRSMLREAVRRSLHWAERCRAAHRRPDQALFAIVQGGPDLELRSRCAPALAAMDFPGYALGGFSVGETPEQMVAVLGPAVALLPVDKPRYLMGVGRPQDLLAAVLRGIDMFDCVLPTRNGRNASAFTDEGTLRLRNACHKRDSRAVGVRLSLLHLPEFQPGVPASSVSGEGNAGPDAAVAAQRRLLLPADGGIREAIDERRDSRSSRSPSCPLGRNRFKMNRFH